MTTRTPTGHEIAVVGLGIAGVHQLTRQVEETIRRSTRVFVTETGTGLVEYLADLGTEVVDLSNPAAEQEHRIVAYRRMASDVVSAALEDPPVCFATYGHPTMYCYPTLLIQRAAMVLDLKVAVIPGVSFLDTLLTDLGIDPGFDGLQLYEATDLLVRRRPLQPDVSAVITQAPMVANPYNRAGERRLDHVKRLQDYLSGFYPATHEAALVTSAPHPLLDPLIHMVPIGSLAAALLTANQLCTLFIPPVHHRAIADEHLAATMRVPDGAPADPIPQRRPGRPPIGPRPDAP
jgi:uncharacterized protein YabN with tetrapyrrole methylase and pyrophosphatase domain